MLSGAPGTPRLAPFSVVATVRVEGPHQRTGSAFGPEIGVDSKSNSFGGRAAECVDERRCQLVGESTRLLAVAGTGVVDEQQVDVRRVVELAAAPFAECDHRQRDILDTKAFAAICRLAGMRMSRAFLPTQKAVTRVASGRVMNTLAPLLPTLVGGSADLDPSTHTALKGLGDFGAPAGDDAVIEGSIGVSFAGRNLHFGVREHAMGAITNGLAAHGGTLPYGATFLIFSDYMRPPIRLAALMKLHVIHVFTHDSIALGEDGPTHQPVEQLASLRAIPNVTVIRPADANETAVAWRVACETRARPVVLVLTRQSVPTLDRRRFASAEGLRRGAEHPDRRAGQPARADSDCQRIGGRSDGGRSRTSAVAKRRRSMRLHAERGPFSCVRGSNRPLFCLRL